MGWTPEVTVAAVVMRDGRFLMVEERIAGELVLNQPAGHLEESETLEAAVIREAREETAWRFVPHSLVGTYLWRNPTNGRSFLRFTFYSALAQSTGYFAFLVAADSSGVSVPAVLASQASVVGMVISFFVLRERLSRRQLAGIAVLLTGVAVVAATR